MPYRIAHDTALGLIEVAYMGSITGDDLRMATSEAVALQRRSGALNFLVDAGAWDLQASVLDIYHLPEDQYWDENVDRASRIAVILPAHDSAKDGARFFEDASRNRGWNVRVLPDRAAAVEWLGRPR